MNIMIAEAALLILIMILQVILCPFTKVEESFNIQAAYDLIYKHWNSLKNFDHISFPGVVPRTFLGPLSLTPVPYILSTIFQLTPFTTLHLVRITLGLFNIISLLSIRTALSQRFSPVTATFFTLLTASQFHLLFYSSRTLPNSFALIITNFSLANRLRRQPRPYVSLALLSLATALFRSELSLYMFATLLYDLPLNHLSLLPTLKTSLSTAITIALISICIDSYFWRRLSYPELEVFYFNAILNKSSAWGTQPSHWYFSNALPRALGGAYILAFSSLFAYFKSLIPIMFPALFFVAIYSALPHKELRFIFYVLPVFNVAASFAMASAWRTIRHTREAIWGNTRDGDIKGNPEAVVERGRKRRILWAASLALLSVATIVTSLLQTVISSAASRANYPSGYALRAMHEKETQIYKQEGMCGRLARVHVDVDAAMNGVSQFVQDVGGGDGCVEWEYSKREDFQGVDWEWGEFTHLVGERESIEGFCLVHVEKGYAGIDWRRGSVKLRNRCFVLRNLNVSKAGCLESELDVCQ